MDEKCSSYLFVYWVLYNNLWNFYLELAHAKPPDLENSVCYQTDIIVIYRTERFSQGFCFGIVKLKFYSFDSIKVWCI